MSLFKSNCILKSDGIVFKGTKPLKTKTIVEEINDVEEVVDETETLKVNEEIEEKLQQTKQICDDMISKAQEESEKIIQQAKDEYEDIKKKAYEEGHNIGMKNGYEDGYKESYEDNIEKAKQESEQIINKANYTLMQANEQVVGFLKENKKEIISLSISIAEKVLKEKFQDTNAMNNLIEATINEYEIKENFVIRTNAIYVEEVNEKLNQLKNQQVVKGEIFVLSDELIEPGNAIIETNKGRLIVGIDCILEKVKEELL